jgi:formylglycine-generating enzyme required for sulfatase activity
VIITAMSGCKKTATERTPDYRRDLEFTVGGDGGDFTMIYVAGGSFTMGATAEQDSDWDSCEEPTHDVTLSDYHLGKLEVTQGLWTAVMNTTIQQQCDLAGKTSLYGAGAAYPMYYVSYNECGSFCSQLNVMLADKLPAGYEFRLPTEAQWEYAARGRKTEGFKYSGSSTIDDVAWYWDNSETLYRASEAGRKLPNELGICDMSGNVWECCSDWYDDYGSASVTDPQGPNTGSYRVYRGGSWENNAEHCRVSYRYFGTPIYRDYALGFRLAFVRK